MKLRSTTLAKVEKTIGQLKMRKRFNRLWSCFGALAVVSWSFGAVFWKAPEEGLYEEALGFSDRGLLRYLASAPMLLPGLARRGGGGAIL